MELQFSRKSPGKNRDQERIDLFCCMSLQRGQRFHIRFQLIEFGDDAPLAGRSWERNGNLLQIVEVKFGEAEANLFALPISALSAAKLVLPLCTTKIGVEVIRFDNIRICASNSDMSVG